MTDTCTYVDCEETAVRHFLVLSPSDRQKRLMVQSCDDHLTIAHNGIMEIEQEHTFAEACAKPNGVWATDLNICLGEMSDGQVDVSPVVREAQRRIRNGHEDVRHQGG